MVICAVYHHTTYNKTLNREERMIKRVSLVWKRPELTNAEFRRVWLGEHVEYAKRLAGLREYVIDFVTDAPTDAPSGIATLRFDSHQALETAFSEPALNRDLIRTREQFARTVQVMIVDEEIVVPSVRSDVR
jgi:uncharacterized protein (TIGR02118 family)